MISNLKKIKKIYESGENIISYLRSNNNSNNLSEMIQISYDIQAGNYTKKAETNPSTEKERSYSFASIINNLGDFSSILEVGVGEATSFTYLISQLKNQEVDSYGFDISFSRILYGNKFLKKTNTKNANLFLGSYFNCPIQDNSIDIVYTIHSLEPNGGKEKEMLQELYRISSKYLILFEPIYELSSKKGKAHMKKHGYVKNLFSTAESLGYKIIEYKLIFEGNSFTPNSTGVIVIEKTNQLQNLYSEKTPLACPITKKPLELIRNNYFCKDSLLLYPIVDSIPCLLPENAIIATHYLD